MHTCHKMSSPLLWWIMADLANAQYNGWNKKYQNKSTRYKRGGSVSKVEISTSHGGILWPVLSPLNPGTLKKGVERRSEAISSSAPRRQLLCSGMKVLHGGKHTVVLVVILLHSRTRHQGPRQTSIVVGNFHRGRRRGYHGVRFVGLQRGIGGYYFSVPDILNTKVLRSNLDFNVS